MPDQANANNAHNAKTHLAYLERQQVALEMRKQGFTFREIAAHLDCSVNAAHKMVKKAVANINDRLDESAAEVKTIELERLDRILVRLWRQAVPSDVNQPPNLKAVEQVLKIMDRRAKYLGLDAAQKHEVISLDAIDEAIKKLESELSVGDD